MQQQQASMPLFDLDEVRRAYDVLVAPGDVVELRALDAKLHGRGENYGRPYIASGYFDAAEPLLDAVQRIATASGIYLTLNPVVPAVFARRANQVARAGSDELTKDKEIARRRWLLVDLDPERPAGISSTADELKAAKERAIQVAQDLLGEGWPRPVVALSGNGWHLLYRVDLPADDDALKLLECCLAALAARYCDGVVKVDTKVANASRICKLYGTAARKGSHTQERPHRLSRIVKVPEGGTDVVDQALLETLAAAAPAATSATTSTRARRAGAGGAPAARTWDLADWVRRFLPDADGPRDWQGGRRWTLPVCPFDEAHARNEAHVTEQPDGGIAAGCHHDSCRWTWADLRAKLEPPETRAIDALGAVRAAVAALDPNAADGELVAALGPVHEAILAVPPGALRDAACAEVHRALKGRARGLTLKGLRSDVVRAGRARAEAAVILQLGSDVEIAQHVLDDMERVGADEQLVHDRGRLWQYDAETGLWQRLEPSAVRVRVGGLDGVLVKSSDADGAKPLLVGAQRMRNVYTVMLDQRAVPGWFDRQYAPRGLAFANGFLRLHPLTGRLELLPKGPENRATVGYDWPFDPDAHPHRFYSALCDCWPADVDDDADAKIELLREWVGAALLGMAPRFGKALILVGGGANGKSTILSIVQGLFPPESVCAVPPQDATNEYSRAMLAGKRLNSVSELPEAEIMQSETIKALITGDEIKAREIREAPFLFRPEAGHLFSANALPAVRDSSRGFWRRWLLLTFSREFLEHEQIRDLDQSILAEEAAAIVCWAVRGAENLVERGSFIETKEMRAAIDDWQRSADPVKAFHDERCEPLSDAEFGGGNVNGTAAKVLYDEYVRWAEYEGHGRMSSSLFGRRFAQLARRRRVESGVVYAVGMKLTSPRAAADPDEF